MLQKSSEAPSEAPQKISETLSEELYKSLRTLQKCQGSCSGRPVRTEEPGSFLLEKVHGRIVRNMHGKCPKERSNPCRELYEKVTEGIRENNRNAYRRAIEECTKELSDSVRKSYRAVYERAVEQCTRKLDEKVGHALAPVSHDLRAPLRAIDGFSTALLETYRDKLGEEGMDYLQHVRTATQRMGQLIGDLLKLSRVTRDRMRWENVDLSQIARDVVDELRMAHPERKVEISIADRECQRRCEAADDHDGEPPGQRLEVHFEVSRCADRIRQGEGARRGDLLRSRQRRRVRHGLCR